MPLPLRQLDLGKIESFAVYSDVHLRNPNEELASLFLSNLKAQQGKDCIFLLGDIFDFIFVAKDFYLKLWKNFFDILEDLGRSGTRVVFVEGNHDFGFEHFLRTLGSGTVLCGDVEVFASHAKLGNLVFRHGDDVVCPPSYLPFRRVVKSKSLQTFARFVPAKIMDALCLWWSTQSRGDNETYHITEGFLRACVTDWLKHLSCKTDIAIFGHIHVLVDLPVDSTRVMVGPDWITAPSVLICERSGELRREYLTDKRPHHCIECPRQ